MPKPPLVISMTGQSDSGKTRLLLALLPALKKKGYRVAVAKHCPHGFDLDLEGKDSSRFTRAGGEGTLLTSEDRVAVIRPRPAAPRVEEYAQSHFADFDFVLMEGYNYEPGLKKMLLIRSGIGELDPPVKETEIVAYVSDLPIDTEKPVYDPDDAPGIISFLESLRTQESDR
jgi:molybdopterin-guanine dinucleotide biosynthesis protein B